MSISLALSLLILPRNSEDDRKRDAVTSSFLNAILSVNNIDLNSPLQKSFTFVQDVQELPSMKQLLQSLDNDSQLKQEHTKILLTLKNEIRSGKSQYQPLSLVQRGIIVTIFEAVHGVAVDDLVCLSLLETLASLHDDFIREWH